MVSEDFKEREGSKEEREFQFQYMEWLMQADKSVILEIDGVESLVRVFFAKEIYSKTKKEGGR